MPTNNANTAVGFTYTGGTYADYIAIGSVAADGGTQLNAISHSQGIFAGTYADSSGFSQIFTLAHCTTSPSPTQTTSSPLASTTSRR